MNLMLVIAIKTSIIQGIFSYYLQYLMPCKRQGVFCDRQGTRAPLF